MSQVTGSDCHIRIHDIACEGEKNWFIEQKQFPKIFLDVTRWSYVRTEDRYAHGLLLP